MSKGIFYWGYIVGDPLPINTWLRVPRCFSIVWLFPLWFLPSKLPPSIDNRPENQWREVLSWRAPFLGRSSPEYSRPEFPNSQVWRMRGPLVQAVSRWPFLYTEFPFYAESMYTVVSIKARCRNNSNSRGIIDSIYFVEGFFTSVASSWIIQRASTHRYRYPGLCVRSMESWIVLTGALKVGCFLYRVLCECPPYYHYRFYSRLSFHTFSAPDIA